MILKREVVFPRRRLWPFLLFLGSLWAVTAHAQGASDRLVRSPLPVAYPPAGGSYVDPSFGTKVVRATDARNGRRCVHAYSYWRAFNADGTRLLLACDDVPLLFRFDPATGAVAPDGPLFGTDGPPLQFEGASWSRDFPNTLYALDRAGLKLYRLDVSRRGARGYTLLRDFATFFPGKRFKHLTVSDGGTVFSMVLTESGATLEAIVWRRTDNRILHLSAGLGETINETQISKAGHRVVVHYDSGRADLWNLTTGAVTMLPNSTGHWDNGVEWMSNGDGILTGAQVRTYADPLAPGNILRYLRDGKPVWCIAEHTSLRADDESRMVLSTYGRCSVWAPMEDEIILVQTNGFGFLRLAHTRSCECAGSRAERYYSQPRAVPSRDGRWIVWTSDLGSATRTDVLIVKVP